jgi:histidinol phosphatase-like enzyme (inositol monophosphatase family)
MTSSGRGATPNQLWLEAALELATRTGRVALGKFRKGLKVDLKRDDSPVTEADRAAEQFAREWIAQRFADHGVMGEEFGETNPSARYRWLIDPIDGTRTFVAGVPLWGTLVALCEGETVIAGAASYPAAGESIAAATGEGCWSNGARCQVSTTTALERAVVLTTDERFKHAPQRRDGWMRLAAAANTSRTWGDCYGYLLVATGRAEVMVDGSMMPWDAAPFVPIVTEAGGVFVDYSGRTTGFGTGAVATNGALAAKAHTLLGVGA